MTEEQIAEYKRRLLSLPNQERQLKTQGAETQARFGNALSPTEQGAINDQIARLRRDDYSIDDSLSALADGYMGSGRPVAAEALYKRVINDLDFGPSDYLEHYQPPYWGPPHRISNRLVTILNLAYPELIKLLVAKGRYEEALEYAERARSKHLQAVMQTKPGESATKTFPLMGIAQMRSLARDFATTFVIYSLLHSNDDHLYRDRTKLGITTLFAWVLQPSGQIHFVSLPVNSTLNNVRQTQKTECPKL